MAFSPDGQTIASGACGGFDDGGKCTSGEIVLWNVTLADWKTRACQIANRSLMPLEWERYLKGQTYRTTT